MYSSAVSLSPTYEMISKCPSNYEPTAMRAKCEQTDTSRANIIDIVLVLDKNTNMAYKNINCAFCNGKDIDQVIMWTTRIMCEKNVPFLFDNRTHTLEMFLDRQDCKLSFFLPDSVNHRAKKCSYLIDRCNVTGLYTGEDPFLERACASYTSIYMYTHYKNVCCFLCNENTEYSVAEECFLSLHSEWIVKFAGIFDFTKILASTKIDNGIESICASTSVFDKSTVSEPDRHQNLSVSVSLSLFTEILNWYQILKYADGYPNIELYLFNIKLYTNKSHFPSMTWNEIGKGASQYTTKRKNKGIDSQSLSSVPLF